MTFYDNFILRLVGALLTNKSNKFESSYLLVAITLENENSKYF